MIGTPPSKNGIPHGIPPSKKADETKIKSAVDAIEALSGCGGCVSLLILLAGVGNLWCAYVVTVLWRWAVVPAGMPPLGLGTALALDAIVSIWTLRGIRKGEEVDAFKTLLAITVMPAAVLGVVWFWLKVIAWLG